jgi:hypothetical protein
LEAENRKKQLELEKRELDLREQSLKLRESLQRADVESNEQATSQTNQKEVEFLSSPSPSSPIRESNTLLNQSKWIQLIGTGLVVENHHLCNAEIGAEFACVHNRDSSDFMNQEKFERFILKKQSVLNHMNGT